MSRSILILGGGGRLGIQITRAVKWNKSLENAPKVHGFVREKEDMSHEVACLYDSIIEGNALKEDDVHRALKETEADIVVLAIGKGYYFGPTLVRSKCAKTLIRIVKPGSEFEHVRIVAIATQGSGGTCIPFCYGMGLVLTALLGFVLLDHTLQIRALRNGIGKDEEHKKRLLVVHATGFTSGAPKGEPMVYEKEGPTREVDREDFARWLIAQACGEGPHFGTSCTLTGCKKRKKKKKKKGSEENESSEMEELRDDTDGKPEEAPMERAPGKVEINDEKDGATEAKIAEKVEETDKDDSSGDDVKVSEHKERDDAAIEKPENDSSDQSTVSATPKNAEGFMTAAEEEE